jgi:flagellar motor component MotA
MQIITQTLKSINLTTHKKLVLMLVPGNKIVRYLPTVGLSADVLLLIVHMSVLAECADINKGLAAVLVAAEEKDLCGGFRLGRIYL